MHGVGSMGCREQLVSLSALFDEAFEETLLEEVLIGGTSTCLVVIGQLGGKFFFSLAGRLGQSMLWLARPMALNLGMRSCRHIMVFIHIWSIRTQTYMVNAARRGLLREITFEEKLKRN